MSVHPHGEKISAYLDGMLDVAQMREVAAHLGGCSTCRAAHEGLRETQNLLCAITPPAAPSPDFWADAYRRMRVEDTAKRPAVGVSWGTLRDTFREPQRRWSAGVTAVALLTAAIAGPMFSVHPTLSVTPPISAPAPDFVDVSSLVQAHTESAAHQPLADADRQDMIAMDDSFTADDDSSDAGGDAAP